MTVHVSRSRIFTTYLRRSFRSLRLLSGGGLSISGAMFLDWLAVALAFGIPFAGGVLVQDWLERRDSGKDRLVPLFYLVIPLASALLVGFLLRSELTV
jgi:hypothetical protein